MSRAGPAPWSSPTRRKSCDTPTFRWSSSPDMAGAAGGGPRVMVHADESCLGNDRSKPSPGGNAALIEAPAADSAAQGGYHESARQTNNNQMALAGAITTVVCVRLQWKHVRVV